MKTLKKIGKKNLTKQVQSPKVISLCSGAGLADDALRAAGLNIAVQVEIEEVQKKILRNAFPEAMLWNDIFTFNREAIENEEINPEEATIVGGLCCQPFSQVGPAKGRGKSTWMCAELVRITEELKPRLVVVENVAGFINHPNGLAWLDAEMEKIRYEVGEATCFPASSLGAPHERQRIFQIYTRDALSDTSCIGRYLEGLSSYDFFAPCRKNYWHGKRISEPGLPRVAYGNFSNAEKNNIAKRLQIAGNGIVYDQAFFIGRFIKYFNEFFYDNEENKKCLKINL